MTKLCIIAGNYQEALTWVKGQMIDEDSWFYPISEDDLRQRSNFHVIVIGTAGYNIPPSYFERFYALAQSRGSLDRK